MKQKTKKLVAGICMGAAVLTLTPAVSWADTAGVNVNTGSVLGGHRRGVD